MNAKQIVTELIEQGFVEGELSVDPLWYIIWRPEDIAEFNENYEINSYLPGFIGFGDSGSNEILVLSPKGEVFTVPAIGMAEEYADKVANNIEQLKGFMKIGN